jgi:hypothetical protein
VPDPEAILEAVDQILGEVANPPPPTPGRLLPRRPGSISTGFLLFTEDEAHRAYRATCAVRAAHRRAKHLPLVLWSTDGTIRLDVPDRASERVKDSLYRELRTVGLEVLVGLLHLAHR